MKAGEGARERGSTAVAGGRPVAVDRLTPASGRAEAAHWNRVGAEWQHTDAGLLWRTHSDAVNAQLLDRWLPAAAPRLLKTDLFDEAVSNGLHPLLSSRARLVVGVDLAHVIARQALVRAAGLCAAGADVRGLPFRDRCFDVVVSLSTLDHFASLGELEDALGELWRVLREDGTLVLTLDNVANPLVGLRNRLPFALLHRLGLVPYYVGRSCSRRTALQLLDRQGFQVEDCTTVLHVPRVLAVAAAALIQRWAGPLGRARFLAGAMACERLGRWPTRSLTGHFVAIRAVKRNGDRRP